jgi:membrane associated rhomboid family serine protease
MLIGANVAVFVAQVLFPIVTAVLGLHPALVLHSFWIWQLATYMFLHGGVFHIVFNMLALWMFGAELERTWGTRYFLKFYFVTGIGAAVLTVLFSLLPFGFARSLQDVNIIGASGAIYGLLLAYAIYFPNNRVMLLFPPIPMPARVFVLLYAALELYLGVTGSQEGVAHFAHLGGMVGGYAMMRLWRRRTAPFRR